MTEITIIDLVLAAIGGVLIGLSAITLLAMNGRIAGISGIVGGIIRPDHSGDMGWRVAFVGGLLLGPLLTYIITQRPVEIAVAASTPTLIIAGLLVGLGTAIGSGCTSGHGVCGI
ncbi:MAG: YeeE/YedE family protein, partial [Pseudomonadota bacterium]